MSLEAVLASLRPGGRDFEHLCKWALENVPEYQSRLTQVWLWDDWPGRWEPDSGVRPKLKGKPPHRAQSGYGRVVGCGLPGALTE